MLKYIETKDESACCGCRACEQLCPTNALSMQKNAEGFLYPELNTSLCINCKLCEKFCPVQSLPKKQKPIAVYAVQHKDQDILKKSSSGGVFRLLADKVISLGGCVVGCSWGDNFNPVLKLADTVAELEQMQGSKYLSSDTVDIYAQTEKRLLAGQTVLFTGAPCQCAGLLNFLRKPYPNLLTADFLCHGMPSQDAFNMYLDSIKEKHYGKKDNEKPIQSFSFRDKERRGWGHTTSYKLNSKSGSKKYYNVGLTDTYDYAFLKGYLNRYSCYSCPFRGEERFTDFTFCDFWGIQSYHPEIDSTNGVSALCINSERALKLQNELLDSAIWVKTTTTNVAKENATLIHTEAEPIPELRKTTYSLIKKNGWRRVSNKYFKVKNYRIKRAFYAMPPKLARKLKSFLRIG